MILLGAVPSGGRKREPVQTTAPRARCCFLPVHSRDFRRGNGERRLSAGKGKWGLLTRSTGRRAALRAGGYPDSSPRVPPGERWRATETFRLARLPPPYFREGAWEPCPAMLPASLARVGQRGEWVRVSLGRWLLAPPGWALAGPGPCLRWRHQPPLGEPAPLLRAARQSIGTQAGGARSENPGDNSKHVSVQRDRKEETLLSAAQKGKTGCGHS